MSYRIENALAFAPGVVATCLDNEDMVIDPEGGDYVPFYEINKDPLRRKEVNDVNKRAPRLSSRMRQERRPTNSFTFK